MGIRYVVRIAGVLRKTKMWALLLILPLVPVGLWWLVARMPPVKADEHGTPYAGL